MCRSALAVQVCAATTSKPRRRRAADRVRFGGAGQAGVEDVGQSGRVTGVDQRGRVPGHFLHGRPSGGDQGDAAGQRLEGGETEALVARGVDGGGGRSKQGRDRLVGQVPGAEDAIGRPRGGDGPVDLGRAPTGARRPAPTGPRDGSRRSGRRRRPGWARPCGARASPRRPDRVGPRPVGRRAGPGGPGRPRAGARRVGSARCRPHGGPRRPRRPPGTTGPAARR